MSNCSASNLVKLQRLRLLILNFSLFRSNCPEVFLRKGVLKIYSKFAREHTCRSVISIKLLCAFIPFSRNTSGWRRLTFTNQSVKFTKIIWFESDAIIVILSHKLSFFSANLSFALHLEPKDVAKTSANIQDGELCNYS